MVKHIILWQLKDEFSIAEKENIKRRIKIELEGLKDKIPGLIYKYIMKCWNHLTQK